jgi:predicted nucleotide-binding protein
MVRLSAEEEVIGNAGIEAYEQSDGTTIVDFLDGYSPFVRGRDTAAIGLAFEEFCQVVIQETMIEQQQLLQVSNRVFVVHGHDEEAKQSVARCIEKLGLKAIILHEQPNQGRTVIEKFEDYSDVGFVVVLLTPDDIGARKGEEPQPRARQNVILELGFFIGRLGRRRVCALHKGDVEIPSDITGVLWIPIDSADAWHLALAREMKAAGLEVDLNRLV